jgi:acetyl esterase/lipase
MTRFHPELHATARFLPRFSFTPRIARFVNFLTRLRGVPRPPVAEGVRIEDVSVAGPAGAPALRVRLYRPQQAAVPVPALLWMHGGGFLFGTPEFDELNNIELARGLGILVAAVDYRLAPAHPFPAPLEDCYSVLRWLHAEAATLGLDPARIAIGGSSAGAGLAAGLALLAHDRAEVPVTFQLLLYPMLDDRTVLRGELKDTNLRLWDTASNRHGWSAYLGAPPGSEGVSPYAAPARREDLRGLPPAWMGVGTFDLFHDEDLAYARRLNAAGVDCEVQVVEAAYHGFDAVSRKAAVSQRFRASYTARLQHFLRAQPV